MDPVYLDYAATTPIRDEVRAAMEPYASERFGNPSSVHRWGREAEAALEEARARVAGLLGATPGEIHFVRGGTESDNTALLGWSRAVHETGRTPSLFVSDIEHHAVLHAAERAAADGATVGRLRVSPDGSVDLSATEGATREGPALLSLMWVNNETGMRLPVEEVARAARAAGAAFHTDAAQALGKVAVDLSDVSVDLLSATGHKMYGPKGTGLLFIRDGAAVAPLIMGGGQERGMRPGTQDVAGAVGLATALHLAVEELETEGARLASLREQMTARLTEALTGVRINSAEATRAPHVLSVAFADVGDWRTLLMALDLEGIAASGGSACNSGAAKSSHVVAALYGPDDAHATVRFSFGAGTDAESVARAADVTIRVVRRLRSS